jgi:diaminohydroxyphosphoribosylaminopyrimidine deaminase/5-amino-6-(5-phosphoribosylamino)uracil reductase
MREKDEHYMRAALAEALKGVGRTSPNPAVGALVVKEGAIVARGYHRKAGTPHAEVHALAAAGGMARGADLYVTLEPCNHTGRTPPCTRAILEAGIARVVIGMADPNPGVTGGGATYLQSRGVEVISGVLEAGCRKINRPFVKQVITGLPWVTMKVGMSLDGRIASSTGQSKWITNEESRRQAHRLRDRTDAILVGVGTVLADDPSLTTRLPGRRGRDPERIILDTNLRISPTAKMLTQQSSAATRIFCREGLPPERLKSFEGKNVLITPVPVTRTGLLELRAVLAFLGKSGMNTLLVEGGSWVHAVFLKEGLVDEVKCFVAPFFIGGDGIPAVGALGLEGLSDARRFRVERTRRFGDDLLIEGLYTEIPQPD